MYSPKQKEPVSTDFPPKELWGYEARNVLGKLLYFSPSHKLNNFIIGSKIDHLFLINSLQGISLLAVASSKDSVS
jgi:hypothetical protein